MANKKPETALVALSREANAHIWNAARGALQSELGTASAVDALKLAGIANKALQPSIRDEFRVCYATACLYPSTSAATDAMRLAARTLIAKANATTKSNDRRTPDEQRIYDRVRAAWSRMLAKCSAETADTRGGANNTAPKPGGAAAAVEAAREIAPPATTRAQGLRHVDAQAATLTMYVEKANGGICHGQLHDIHNLTRKFRTACAALVAKLEESESESESETA